MRRPEIPTVLFLLATVLLWGLWGFLGKLALERRMPPFSIFAAERIAGFAFALVALAVVLGLGKQPPWRAPWNAWGLLSGVAVAAGLVFYYLALQQTGAAIVVPVTATYPAVSVALCWVFLAERPTPLQWSGIALVVLGTTLLLAGNPRPAT